MKDAKKLWIPAVAAAGLGVGVLAVLLWPRKAAATTGPAPQPTPPAVPVSSVTPITHDVFVPGVFDRTLKVAETLEIAMPFGPSYSVEDFVGEGTIIAAGQGLFRTDQKTGISYAKFIGLAPGHATAIIGTGDPGVTMTIHFTVK